MFRLVSSTRLAFYATFKEVHPADYTSSVGVDLMNGAGAML